MSRCPGGFGGRVVALGRGQAGAGRIQAGMAKGAFSALPGGEGRGVREGSVLRGPGAGMSHLPGEDLLWAEAAGCPDWSTGLCVWEAAVIDWLVREVGSVQTISLPRPA